MGATPAAALGWPLDHGVVCTGGHRCPRGLALMRISQRGLARAEIARSRRASTALSLANSD